MRSRVYLKIYVGSIVSLVALAMLTITVLYPSPAGAQSKRPRYEQDLGLVFMRHDELRLNPQSVAERVRNSGHLSLATARQTFEIELVRNDLRAPGYRAETVGEDGVARKMDDQPVNTYKGRVAGMPDSEARFTIDDNKLEGMIITGQESYFVEPALNYSSDADASDYLVYTASDVRPEITRTCATLDQEIRVEVEKLASNAVSDTGVTPDVFSPMKVVEIATEADFEYVSASGGAAAANNEILSIMNSVQAIYQRDIGMTFSVVFQHTWDTAADPYNTGGDAVAMINEFTNVWNANFTGTARDVAHLWTGRSLGGAAGIAWQGVVCRDGAHSYGLSIRETMGPFRVGIPAHEIGHNFGASHCDGVAGCDNTIMVATQFPSNTQSFCQFSVTEITNYVNANPSCLSNQQGNPIDNPRFFVQQHYIDFFNRQPDQGGWDFWTNEITSCGTNQQCIVNKRVNVSAAFFLSIEFQQSGYLVERIYKTAFGDTTGISTCCSGPGTHQISVPIIRFNELVGDTSLITSNVVVGTAGWEQRLENNKQAYVSQFVTRARFTSAYPATMAPPLFVQTLNQNAGSPLSPTEVATLSAEHTAGTKNRARVLRQIAEHSNLVNAEFNRAFVLMQYIGYLRRNPNDPPDSNYTGYDFWLTKLNSFTQPGDDVLVRVQRADMVKAFIESGEYRHRFGP